MFLAIKIRFLSSSSLKEAAAITIFLFFILSLWIIACDLYCFTFDCISVLVCLCLMFVQEVKMLDYTGVVEVLFMVLSFCFYFLFLSCPSFLQSFVVLGGVCVMLASKYVE